MSGSDGGRAPKRTAEAVAASPPKRPVAAAAVLRDPDETPERVARFEEMLHRSGVRTTLYPHQRIAVRWMMRKEGFRSKEERARAAGGILGDDMGLGKTLTAICVSLLGRYLDAGTPPSTPNLGAAIDPRPGSDIILMPTLIVCPKSLVAQWGSEIRTRTSLAANRVVRFHGDVAERRRIETEVATRLRFVAFVVTTYDVLRTEWLRVFDPRTERRRENKSSFLFDTAWDRLFLDEAHRIRNAQSETARSSYALRSRRRWCLTGTPFNNSMKDIAALCRFLAMAPYNREAFWTTEADPEDVDAWRRGYVLRRTKAQVLRDLPAVEERIIDVALDDEERAMYGRIVSDAEADYGAYLRASGVRKQSLYRELLVWLLRMRQVCCHPLLIMSRAATLPFSASRSGQGGGSGDPAAATTTATTKTMHARACTACDCDLRYERAVRHRLRCGHEVCATCGPSVTCALCRFGSAAAGPQPYRGLSSKTRAIVEYVRDALAADSTAKIVVFSQWASFLDLIENAVVAEVPAVGAAGYVRFDGDVRDIAHRDRIVHRFRFAPSLRLMLATLQAGGLGLNLVEANHVVLADLWWNPFVEQQAIDRLHRLGQKRKVHVVRVLADAEIEQAVRSIQDRKRQQARRILDDVGAGTSGGDTHAGLSDEELRSVFARILESRRRRLSQENRKRLERQGILVPLKAASSSSTTITKAASV